MELSSLTTGYTGSKGQRHVVSQQLTATLQSGALTCLLGPNGAGKSTLLRTLCAFQPPLDGQVILHGKPITEYTAAQLSQHIGVVLTERVEVRGMTVRDLVAMGRSPYTGFWGSLQPHDHQVVEESLQQVGIQDLAHRQVATLSDGERQKVMIAKALAQQTPIILLDEPTAFLDFPSKVDMMLLLRRLAHQMDRAIFLSTHDLDMALQTADHLWLLDRSYGLTIGTPADLAANGSLARYFQSDNLTFDAQEMRFRVQ